MKQSYWVSASYLLADTSDMAPGCEMSIKYELTDTDSFADALSKAGHFVSEIMKTSDIQEVMSLRISKLEPDMDKLDED